MIIDKIENLKNYVGVNRHFSKVIEFLEANDLGTLENGKHEIDGPDCFVNIMDTKGKTKEEAVMETHRRHTDTSRRRRDIRLYADSRPARGRVQRGEGCDEISRSAGRELHNMPSGNDGCLLARRRTSALHRNGREYPQGCDKDRSRMTRSGRHTELTSCIRET